MNVKTVTVHADGLFTENIVGRLELLEHLQSVTEGWVQALDTPPGLTFWCNDDGKIIGQPLNLVATMLWWAFDERVAGLDYLAGPVVITGGVDEEGETLSIPDSLLRVVYDLLETGGMRGPAQA